MISASVIIPVTSRNAATYYVSSVALRTCRASTSAHILALDNNGDGGLYQDKIWRDCRALGIQHHYIPGKFNIAEAFNLGTRMTTGEYIAYGTADVIYFHHWLENIIELWQKNPEYFCLVNYSYDAENMPCVRHEVEPINKIVDTGNPSAGVNVLRRDSNYVWDEQFPRWEIDADFLYYIESKGLKAGYCCNARADHMICGIMQFINASEHFDGSLADVGVARQRIQDKWKERYKG